jgi:hypothetical protein
MRIGMTLGGNGGLIAAVEELRNLESAVRPARSWAAESR